MSLFDKLVILTLPLVPRSLVGKIASRYIAGETLDDALRVVQELNGVGCCATLDVLGEFITRKDEAEAAVTEYLLALDRIREQKLDANISIKLTMLGLKLDLDFCKDNMRKLLRRAKELGNFVRIDMEDSSCTSDTLAVFSELRQEFDNVGFVMQSYMRRSLPDIQEQMRRQKQVNVRVCKGIYVEPRRLAYKDMAIINRNYDLLVQRLLENGSYVGIATHDEKLVWNAYRLIDKLNLGQDRFEFQMLLGVDEELRDLIVSDGYKLRVYVPYGKQWYEYSTRRLKENPAVANKILRSVLGMG